jgi:hypothetical protein
MLFTIVSRAAVSEGAPDCVRSKSIALRSANLDLCNFVYGFGAPDQRIAGGLPTQDLNRLRGRIHG